MLRRLDRIASETLGALHREAIDDPIAVLELFKDAAKEGTVLDSGIDGRNEPRRATIVSAARDAVFLAEKNLGDEVGRQVYFNAVIGGATYFFALTLSGTKSAGILRASLPAAIYRAERRDLDRRPSSGASATVIVPGESPKEFAAEVLDQSLHGLSLRLRDATARVLPNNLGIRESNNPTRRFARVCYRTPLQGQRGWTRVGLSISSVRIDQRIKVDRRERIASRSSSWQNLRGLAELGLAKTRLRLGIESSESHEIRTVEFTNNKEQMIRGIVNEWGTRSGSTAVIIPPAWGKTKETLMPLALTIVETFKRSGHPIQVLRYDGTNRRGESHIDPDCRSHGSEYLHFRFSQAASDISSAIDFFRSDPESAPSRVVLITFSLAAVEGRFAMAREGSRVDGWVAVVGVADLQSALRTISGGVDYGYGLLRGIRFGCHELVGVVADMDRTGLDAIEHNMGFLEDARRDMSNIYAPVTWIHGKHDAWMDLNRVAEIMSCGNTRNRKLIEVPTGHQLRSSRAALSTFQLVAEEASEMALGTRLKAFTPSVRRITETRRAELGRLPARRTDLRSFWEDYLLGRDRSLGMEFLTATAAYRNFMESQVRQLRLKNSSLVLDIGAGTGEFALALGPHTNASHISVVEVDFVASALGRAAQRRVDKGSECRFPVAQTIANLDLGRGVAIPFRDRSADAVLASLVVSYLKNPRRLLREAFRVLKPGGRIVLSSMLEDADVSMLFHDGLIEFATVEARKKLSEEDSGRFDEMVRNFLNDGSKLLDLEDRGEFKFWSQDDLTREVANAGFTQVMSILGLGEPAQAAIVSATKP